MRMCKRLIATVLSVVLLMGMAPSHAASGAVVTGESVTTVAGREIEYRVSIAGNPGLASFNFHLSFDTDVLSLVYKDDGTNIDCTQGDFSNKGMMTCGVYDNGCQVFWSHSSDVTADGTLFVLKLRVKEDAQLGEYPVKLTCVSRNTINKAEEFVSVTCVNGSVTVREFVPTIYAQSVAVKQGETLDYTVSLRDNPGLAAYNVQVLFDSDVLTLADEAITPSETAFTSGSLSHKEYLDAVDVLWHAVENTKDEGELFTLHFEVKKDAKLGKYPVSVLCVPENTLDQDEQDVSFACEDGEIEILTSAVVDFELKGNSTAKITVGQAPAVYAVGCLYTTGKQAKQIQTADVVNGVAEIVLSQDNMSAYVCKVFLFDGDWRPVGPVFEHAF